jgi:pimeloyl-ACP methyl ester carboxylesterase
MSTKIIVFLPGTTGSTLVRGNDGYNPLAPVWPYGVLGQAVFNPAGAAQTLEGTLYPGALFVSRLNPSGGYQSFVDYFTSKANFPGGQSFSFCSAQAPFSPTVPPNWGWGLPGSLSGNLLIAFPYDWRQDCATTAQALQNMLGQLATLYGTSGYELYLVGHSMGGLVCRAYLENGLAAAAGQPPVQALITLGTPHLGAPQALVGIMGDLPVPPAFANLISQQNFDTMVQDFVDDSYSDSTFELLPPPVLEQAETPPYTRYIQDNGVWFNLLDADVPAGVTAAVTATLPQPNDFTVDCSEAQAFFSTLNYAGSGALPPYYCVYGTGLQTCTGFTYQAGTPGTLQQVTGDGDVVVPAWSAQFLGRSTPVAGTYPASQMDHFQLPSDSGTQRQVATWMGLSPAGITVQVHRVVGVAEEAAVGAA